MNTPPAVGTMDFLVSSHRLTPAQVASAVTCAGVGALFIISGVMKVYNDMAAMPNGHENDEQS